MKKRDVIFTLLGIFLIGFVLFAVSKPKLKRWSESVSCVNYMSSIGVAARLWANDSSNRLADNFLVMSNELCTPKILICPSDKTRKMAESWATFTTNNSSYEILRPGMSGDDFTNAYFRCTVHGYLCFANGMIFDPKEGREKQIWK
jgi:hypothetical protein